MNRELALFLTIALAGAVTLLCFFVAFCRDDWRQPWRRHGRCATGPYVSRAVARRAIRQVGPAREVVEHECVGATASGGKGKR